MIRSQIGPMPHPVLLTTMRSVQRHCLQWLLLVVAVFGQGRIAEATCGDHLVMQDHPTIDSWLDRSAASAPEAEQPTPYPVCLGPNCQRREPIPARPTNEFSPPPVMDGVLPLRPSLISSGISHAERTFQAAEIDGPPGRVFRPPRVG